MSKKIITLKLTNKCNLACTYCYNYENVQINDIINPIDSNKNFIFWDTIIKKEIKEHKEHKELKEKNFDILQFEFFGGETLIEWETIKQLLLKYKDNNIIKFKIPTNGFLLTKEIYDFILDYKNKNKNKLIISLSYDGLWSDYTRPQQKVFKDLNVFSWDKYLVSILPFFDIIDVVHCMISPIAISPKNSGEKDFEISILKNFLHLKNIFKKIPIEFAMVRDNKTWTEKTIKKLYSDLFDFYDFFMRHAGNEYYFKNIPSIFNEWVIKILIKEFNNIDIPTCGVVGPYQNKIAYLHNSDKTFSCNYFYTKKYDYDTQQELLNKAMHNNICNTCSISKYCSKGCLAQIVANDFIPEDELCQVFKILYNFARDIIFKAYKRNITNNANHYALYNHVQNILKNEGII